MEYIGDIMNYINKLFILVALIVLMTCDATAEYLYVADNNNGSILKLDTDTMAVVDELPIDPTWSWLWQIGGLKVSGNYLYVAAMGNYNYAVQNGTLIKIDLTTFTEVQRVHCGSCVSLDINASKNELYTVNMNDTSDANPAWLRVNVFYLNNLTLKQSKLLDAGTPDNPYSLPTIHIDSINNWVYIDPVQDGMFRYFSDLNIYAYNDYLDQYGNPLSPWSLGACIDGNSNIYKMIDEWNDYSTWGWIGKNWSSNVTIDYSVSSSMGSSFTGCAIDSTTLYFPIENGKIFKYNIPDMPNIAASANYSYYLPIASLNYVYFHNDKLYASGELTNGSGYIFQINSNTLAVEKSYIQPASLYNIYSMAGETLLPSIYDPSGYVINSSGMSIFNAKVQLSNSTWTDPCISSCFSDTLGYWNTDIYMNGTYNYTVSKSGYTTLTGSQVFTIGGINNNFTIAPSGGLISGHIYTTSPSTGSIPIIGDLDTLKKEYTKKSVFVGNTLTLPGAYVIKVIDIDSAAGQGLITIYLEGNEIYTDQWVLTGQKYQYKINEDPTKITYISIDILSVFGSREIGKIEMSAGFLEERKATGTMIAFISSIISAPTIPGGWSFVMINLANLLSMTTDGSNVDYALYNSTSGQDVTGSYVFDVSASGNIYNFYAIMNAESTTANAGKVEMGYTDDNVLVAPGVTDTLYINQKQLYRGTTTDFKSLDSNGNNKIRVWFTFKSGYSNFKLHEFYINALGATTTQPLSNVNVYYSGTSNTLSGFLGEYQLSVPLGTNIIYFYKTGYESKNVSHLFDGNNPLYSYDVVLNATNRTINLTEEYIYVIPNPITAGVQAHAWYKTLDKTNFVLGGYQISVCPLISGDCEKYDVPANTETSIPLNTYGIGEYTISLTGYKSWEVFRTTIVSNNFTVISSSPSVKWGTSPYYLGETMVLNTYVPSGNSVVNIYYPNGSILFTNNYSASSLIYNISFQTNANLSLNLYPFGAYVASIQNGNTVTTQLLNQSVSEYSLTVPDTLERGALLNIMYTSPRTTTLYMTDSNNVVWISKDVSGTKTEAYNTTKLPNRDTVLKVQLIQGITPLSTKYVNISKGAVSTYNGTWTPTEDNIENTCSYWDNCVRMMSSGQGVNDVTRMMFALGCMAVMMFMGMIVSKGNFGVSLILGFIPYAFFTYITISTPCGSYMPLWVTIFLALIIGIKMRWFN